MLAVVFAWIATDPIPALTPDSVQYLSAAQSLAAGNGLVTSVTPLEAPEARLLFADWPPLYPILLSLGAGAPAADGVLPAAPLRWARWLNLLALAASFIPLTALASIMAGPRGVAPVLAFYAVFRPIQLVNSFGWSESLFILFELLSWAALAWAMHRTPSRPVRGVIFVLAGLLAAAAVVTRYVGLTIPAAGAIVIISRTQAVRARQTLRRLLLFLLPALLPIAIWLARNLLATGDAFGAPRPAAELAPERVVLSTLRTIARDWVCPLLSPESGAARVTGLLGLGAIGWMAGLALHRHGPWTMESQRDRLTLSGLLTTFTLLYVLVMIASAGMIQFDPLDSRLLAPVYPAVLLLCAGLLRGAYTDPRTSVWQRRGALAAGMMMLALNTLASTHWALAPREDRSLSWPYWRTVSISESDWKREAALALTADLPADAVIISDVWELVALHAGRPAKPVPGRKEPGAMNRVLAHAGAYVLAGEGFRADRLGEEDFAAVARGGMLRHLKAQNGLHLYRIERAAIE